MMFNINLFAHNISTFRKEEKTYRKDIIIMTIKKVLCCSAAAIFGGALAWTFKDDIKNCICSVKDMMCRNSDCCCLKPEVVLVHDSNACDQDNSCNITNELECLLADLYCIADINVIDVAKASPDELCELEDYKKRFGIGTLPAILILTNENALTAKPEAPESVFAASEFIESNI